MHACVCVYRKGNSYRECVGSLEGLTHSDLGTAPYGRHPIREQEIIVNELIPAGIESSGNMWYEETLRDLQVVLPQEEFGNHCVEGLKRKGKE